MASVMGMLRYSNNVVQNLLSEADAKLCTTMSILASSFTARFSVISDLKLALNEVSLSGKLRAKPLDECSVRRGDVCPDEAHRDALFSVPGWMD